RLPGEPRPDARPSAPRARRRGRAGRRAAARSPPPRRLGPGPAAGPAGRRRDAQPAGHRPDGRGRRPRAGRGPGARIRLAHQAVQPHEARGPDRHAAARHFAPAPPAERVAVTTWAAILAGGSGTRFWPLSTPQRPKQFLPLAGDRPLLVQAVERLEGPVPAERVLILTGPFLVDQVAAAVPQIPRPQILAEARSGTRVCSRGAWRASWGRRARTPASSRLRGPSCRRETSRGSSAPRSPSPSTSRYSSAPSGSRW